MKIVTDNVYCFTGLRVGRVYLIVTPEGLAIIDASLPPAGPAILRQMQAAGYGAKDVRWILITHAHPDHVGALPMLREATGAQVVASALEKPVIEGKQPIPRVDPSQLKGLSRWMSPAPTVLPPTPVDLVVGQGDTLPILGGLQVLDVPGHSPGHLAFWHPQLRLLFCGDVLFHIRKIGLPFAFFTVDMAENIRSIHKLAALQPDILCFGHGEPLHGASAELEAFSARLKQG